MTDYQTFGRLSVSSDYLDFVRTDLLAGLDMDLDRYCKILETVLVTHKNENQALLDKRTAIQSSLDKWHSTYPGPVTDLAAYQDFLRDIGYLIHPKEDFTIETENVDPEIASVAGPQLVVPVDNARYALNAANARWGSLYDALYGTDAMGSSPKGKDYDPARGSEVIAWAKTFLDNTIPLQTGSHTDVTAYRVEDGTLAAMTQAGIVTLRDPDCFIGWRGDAADPSSLLLEHNGLHLDLLINRDDAIGAADPAGVADIILESALTSIMDCEDSVATIAPSEKVTAYRNWLGLMRGDLTARFKKGGNVVERTLDPVRTYQTPIGSDLTLKGQVVMLVRNVGHLTTHSAVLLDGEPVFEGQLDALTTVTAALHDRIKKGGTRNAKAGSIYIVKPKMHGPDEVSFAVKIFAHVEEQLGLAPKTIKIGIMDEERRTSVNLMACVERAKDRVFFINTGFLDRTGDEIHTIKRAGPVITKGAMKGASWIAAYEARNVDVGLKAGFRGKAQIGKGMWAMPDLMHDLMTQKIGQLEAGATTAWVPSPTAATLHAVHYHRVFVADVQQRLAQRDMTDVAALLDLPLAASGSLTPDEIKSDLERNAQSILGYVVRWIDQGVGCSKVPDIDNIGLMEDRATLRISSQHIANWLMHGLITEDDIIAAFRRMALVVDEQNAGDKAYQPMAPAYDGTAFKAALELALEGALQPSGYTEPVLGRRRAEALKL